MPKRPNKRPRDLSQLAKSIVDEATGEAPRIEESEKSKAARDAGRHGGQARAAALTSEQRAQIAKNAALKRWGKKSTKPTEAGAVTPRKRAKVSL
jgi:hypothetical protein